MTDKFYITTPIYYVNDVPHIGHAYTTVAADILARYNRLKDREVFFLTGTDEHGQKVEKAAKGKGLTPKGHADIMVENFKSLWKKLDISNDAFIRTTDPEHIKTVQELISLLRDSGEIQKRQYAGWYCTPDERFWTEKDLVDGNCPDCGRPVEQIQEENYFFLMSKYQEKLIRHIEENSSYILPETRRNEVLGFLKNNALGDLCISRPKSRLAWGIPLPFDENFVTYVWFDALVNYYSATCYLAPEKSKEKGTRDKGQVTSDKSGPESSISPGSLPLVPCPSSLFWWPADHHLVGKDILTTHAVYWSTMLMALRFPLPKNIFAHGWWTVDGKKMSKSFGNVVDTTVMVEKYGADAFRYFLFREVPFGLDGDFSETALVNRINTDLANDLGNLLSRFLTMAEKYCSGTVKKLESFDQTGDFVRQCIHANSVVHDEMNWSRLRFNLILDNIREIIRAANNYIARTEPWKLSKSNLYLLVEVIFNVWNALRLIAVSLYVFMPSTAGKMWTQLGLRSLTDEVLNSLRKGENTSIFHWDWYPDYEIKVCKGEQLFPRINIKDTGTVAGAAPQAPEQKPEDSNLVSIEEFGKVRLKIGKIISAERVPKSAKLIKLQVDTGEPRQVVAGIGQAYAPEDLIGKNIVVVTNLKPAKLMGVESQGMLLAATDSNGILSILVPEKEVKEGAAVK